MGEKLKIIITSTESHIKWEQELIDRYTESIREYVKTCSAENMTMFLPGKIKELEDAITRSKEYTEQLNMLQYIQKEN